MRIDCKLLFWSFFDLSLLSGSLDPMINVFDLERMHSPEKFQFKPLVSIGTSRDFSLVLLVGPKDNIAHKMGVTSVSWYPVDTGMFVSSSLDGTVNLWDTNCEEVIDCFLLTCLTEQVIKTFYLDSEVYSASLSPCAQEHTLIAAACDDAKVYLCDILTGKSIWKLEGTLLLSSFVTCSAW